MTSLTLTGLYPGVPYNCCVVTLTSQGESESTSIVQTTEEIGTLVYCVFSNISIAFFILQLLQECRCHSRL